MLSPSVDPKPCYRFPETPPGKSLPNVLSAVSVASVDVNDYRPLGSGAELARPQLPNQLFRYDVPSHWDYVDASVPPRTMRWTCEAISEGNTAICPAEFAATTTMIVAGFHRAQTEIRSEVRVWTPTITHTRQSAQSQAIGNVSGTQSQNFASHLHKSVGIKCSDRTNICPWERSDLVISIYNTWNGRSYAGSDCVRSFVRRNTGPLTS